MYIKKKASIMAGVHKMGQIGQAGVIETIPR